MSLKSAQALHAGFIFGFPILCIGIACAQLWQASVKPWMPLLAVAAYVATMLGITVGYHRLLAHRAFKTTPGIAVTLSVLGCMAAQGAPIYWVSNHRRHHLHADAPGDPHSPHTDGERVLGGWNGFLHAHVGWMFTHELTSSVEFSRDLLLDRTLGRINRNYGVCVFAGVVLPMLIGAAIERSWQGAVDGLIWGAGVRLFLSFHLTSSINSVTHLFGYRSYPTAERSTNNLWLGFVTLGEAWHNNHHAAPTSAVFGRRWWELDVGGWLILLLERCGLADEVRRPSIARVTAAAERRTSPQS